MKRNMKSLKIFTIILVTITLTLLVENCILEGGIIQNKTQIIKEMTQSENEANLQTQINTLNASHNDYAINVQNYKKKIAEAITNQGISTSESEDAEIVATNISNILQTRTSNATATADNITAGKTAYVNGKLITGTGKDNDNSYESGMKNSSFTDLGTGTSFDIKTLLPNVDYTKLTEDNFLVGISSIASASSEGFDLQIQSENSGYPIYAMTDGITISKTYDSSTGILTVTGSQTIYIRYLHTNGKLTNACHKTQSATCFAYYIP